MPWGKLKLPLALPFLPSMASVVPLGLNTSTWLLSRLATKTFPVPGWIAMLQAKLMVPVTSGSPRVPNACAAWICPLAPRVPYSTRWFQ